MRRKKSERSRVIANLDKEFSIYIRNRKSKRGKARCYTCGKIDEWKNLQCGHFQSRKHLATRWDEINCQVQCYACNVMRYGEQFKFGLQLDSEYGDGTAEQLFLKAKQSTKIAIHELREKLDYYKSLNKTLKK